jgi:hypothetical protein
MESFSSRRMSNRGGIFDNTNEAFAANRSITKYRPPPRSIIVCPESPEPTFPRRLSFSSSGTTAPSTWHCKRKAIPPPRPLMQVVSEDESEGGQMSTDRIEGGCRIMADTSKNGYLQSPHRPIIPRLDSAASQTLISERLESGTLCTSPIPSPLHGSSPCTDQRNNNNQSPTHDPVTPDRREAGHCKEDTLRFKRWKNKVHLKTLACPPVSLE